MAGQYSSNRRRAHLTDQALLRKILEELGCTCKGGVVGTVVGSLSHLADRVSEKSQLDSSGYHSIYPS
jgi:Cys-tRNA synthase (O-phospho-L-seryl-tRNA:Cys-tRNA synthase)